MARDYIDLKNTGDSIPDWPSGTIRRLLLPNGDSCAYTIAQFNTQAPSNAEKVTLTDPDIPDNLPDKKWQSKDCGLTGFDPDDTVFVRDPTYSDPADPADPADPGSSYDGATVVTSSNPTVMALAVEWDASDNARIVDSVSLSGTCWYFIGGQAPVHTLPTEYTLKTGDEVAIYKIYADSPLLYVNAFNTKATAKVLIGNPPTT